MDSVNTTVHIEEPEALGAMRLEMESERSMSEGREAQRLDSTIPMDISMTSEDARKIEEHLDVMCTLTSMATVQEGIEETAASWAQVVVKAVPIEDDVALAEFSHDEFEQVSVEMDSAFWNADEPSVAMDKKLNSSSLWTPRGRHWRATATAPPSPIRKAKKDLTDIDASEYNNTHNSTLFMLAAKRALAVSPIEVVDLTEDDELNLSQATTIFHDNSFSMVTA